jgi:hypothetical protein
MGKPSIKSRKSSQLCKKKRHIRLIEEVGDLQIQLNDFKKHVEVAGERVFHEIDKCSRENNNLVKWLNLYDEQIANYQKELYNINLKLYFSSSQQPPQQPSQPSQQLPQQPLQQPFQSQQSSCLQESQQQSCQLQPQLQHQLEQSPIYKSMADYFSKNQE